MRMHKLLKQPAHGHYDAKSTGADVAALYLSQASKKDSLPAFFTMDRCELTSQMPVSCLETDSP